MLINSNLSLMIFTVVLLVVILVRRNCLKQFRNDFIGKVYTSLLQNFARNVLYAKVIEFLLSFQLVCYILCKIQVSLLNILLWISLHIFLLLLLVTMLYLVSLIGSLNSVCLYLSASVVLMIVLSYFLSIGFVLVVCQKRLYLTGILALHLHFGRS